MLDVLIAALAVLAAFGLGIVIGNRRAPPVRSAPAAPPGATPTPPMAAASVSRDGAAPAPRDLPTSEEVTRAIRADEFTYFVQPIIDVTTARAVGVEALSRWIRPTGEMLTPDHFLPQMQRNYAAGVSPPLDRTAETARPFTEAGLFCAFNVTSAFLEKSGDETGWMDGMLEPLATDRIVLEITEGSVISHPDRTRRLVDALRERGVRFALDDFGTGLSNLERLQTYPVDFVKLDRRFVYGVGAERDRGILRALAGMRDDLGFEIIAEGIETAEARDRMAEAGIALQQGFLHGRPAPVPEWCARIDAVAG